MTFHGILNLRPDAQANIEPSQPPPYFVDLNLDQILAAAIVGKQEYNLAPFFYAPLTTQEAVEYRQDVMRDLEQTGHFDAVTRLADTLRAVRGVLETSAKAHYKYQKEIWLLDAANLYCGGVRELQAHFRAVAPKSVGLRGFFDYLDGYIDSAAFQALIGKIVALKTKLAAVRCVLVIGGGFITVSSFGDEPDYGVELQADFEKFKQGAARDHIFKFADSVQMNHIEAGILDRVARLNPETFAELDAFAARSAGFFDSTVRQFDREAQFYLAYIAYINRIRAGGAPFCYPTVSATDKTIRVSDGCDIALAKLLIDRHAPIVLNDFHLDGRERIIIVSGPNQGGKTTFARMFGQLHYLASIGCSVPGSEAQLPLFDQLFTHFERQEDMHNLRGKLHDDLFRLHRTLEQATPNSIIVLNEVFNSTSLKDAVFLCTKVLKRIIALDAICVCVTFMDELSSLSDTTVSMASNVNPDNVAERTFKIVRRPADGLAYAISIAEKYRLTHKQLRERLTR